MSTPSRTKTTPATGCTTATSSRTSSSRPATGGAAAKRPGRNGRAARIRAPNTTPYPAPHAIILAVADRAPATSPAPRYLPVIACPAIAIASSASASSVQTRNATWCAAIAALPIRAAGDDGQVGEGRRVLRDDRPPRGSGQAPPQAEDKDCIQNDVSRAGADRDGQGGPGVLEPAQHARPGQHGEHGRRTEQADPQIGDRPGGDGRRRAECVHDERGERNPGREHGRADPAGQPQPVDPELDGGPAVPGAELPGDGGGGPVGQEDRDADQGGQRLAGHTQAAEGHRADPPDNGRVTQQEQRFGHEGAKGRDGEPQDFRVVRAAAEHGPEPAAGCQRGRVHSPGSYSRINRT